MPGNTIRDLSYHLRYGSIAPQHRFELEDGYNVFIGKNDAGKTTFLQWVFRCLYEIQEISKDSFSLILSNRNLISPHTRTTLTLGDFNSNLYQQISTTPLLNDQDRVDGAVDLYSALLQNQNFMEQLVSINEYLARMGFKPIEIKQQQIAYMDNIPLHQHGSGIRHIVSILSALTSSNIGIVLID